MTDPEVLMANALEVISQAMYRHRRPRMAPLFSGGHDSYCACFVASHHPAFDGNVYHIDTGIGSKATRSFVEMVCKCEGWKLQVLKSTSTYEKFVAKLGFPGPGAHQWIYNCIKDHAIDEITRIGRRHFRTVLVTGCRSDESIRRMGHLQPIKMGETSKKSGVVTKLHRIWTSPCHNWRIEDQHNFMDVFGLSRNPIKMSPLGMSGECFCGAFARPNELEMIRQVCPDVAAEIDRLSVIAQAAGRPCVYGGPRDRKKIEVGETGPLCSSCDVKAKYAGIKVVDSTNGVTHVTARTDDVNCPE